MLKENFDYSMTNIHTAFPGVVVKYDKDTRRADIQPSVKRKLPSGEFVDLPVIPDAPVLFPGTKQYTVCYPLEKDDEVLVYDEPLVYGVPLFEDIYDSETFPALDIVPYDESETENKVTWENFGEMVLLTIDDNADDEEAEEDEESEDSE